VSRAKGEGDTRRLIVDMSIYKRRRSAFVWAGFGLAQRCSHWLKTEVYDANSDKRHSEILAALGTEIQI